MIAVGDTLVSEEIIDKKFVCDLNACKGACCVKGDYGAPLEESELAILNRVYKKVEPFLPESGKKAIAEQGKFIRYEKREWVTPLAKNNECAYTVFENGFAKCGIEKAYLAGEINFKKPISCHLYPIRISKHRTGYDALNYDRWSICSAACKLGKSLSVSVYEFLKEPLIRKYGKRWFKQMEKTAKVYEENKKDK